MSGMDAMVWLRARKGRTSHARLPRAEEKHPPTLGKFRRQNWTGGRPYHEVAALLVAGPPRLRQRVTLDCWSNMTW